MARYSNAIWRPTNKHGYPGNDTHLHQGVVIHSAEGSAAGLISVLDSSARQASWHFHINKDGTVYQPVDTDNIAWTSGSYEANRRFWGIECEGGGPGNPGEPLTEPQYQSLLDVVRWLWDTHGLSVFQRQATLWEHREMTRFGAAATSCPSGRIPWGRLISDLQEEDMPTVDEVVAALQPVIRTEAQKAALDATTRATETLAKMIEDSRGWALVKGTADDVYLVTKGRKTHIGNSQGFVYSGYAWGDVKTISDVELNKIIHSG